MAMKMGVVTLDIAWASAIQARSTPASLPGTSNPARRKSPAAEPRTNAGVSRLLEKAIDASTANAMASVNANRLPREAVNAASLTSVERNE